MRKPIAQQRRDRADFRRALILGVIVVAAVAAIVYYKATGEEDRLDKMLCLEKAGPKGHVILLVDKTDPLTFTQAKAFNLLLTNLSSRTLVGEGELLSVFVLGEDFRDTAEPIFEKCNPGDGKDKDPLKNTLSLWKERYEKEFVRPLLSLESEMKSITPGKYSPILQMLQVVAIRFAKHDVRGSKRLIIVSDMLQNSPELSFFKSTPNFKEAQKQPSFSRLRAKLHGVNVTVQLLLHNPQLQKDPLARFWEEYFREMGGTLQKIEALPG